MKRSAKKNDEKHYKISLILKIKNKYDKNKLITSVIKNEHFIYYLQCMLNYPDHDDIGDILNNNDNDCEWVLKLVNLIKFIKNNIFDFSISDQMHQLLSLCTKCGGTALRTIKSVIATASISSVHKITKRI